MRAEPPPRLEGGGHAEDGRGEEVDLVEQRREDDTYPNASRELPLLRLLPRHPVPPVREPQHALEGRHHVDWEIAKEPPADRCALTLILPEPE